MAYFNSLNSYQELQLVHLLNHIKSICIYKIISSELYMDIIDLDESSYRGSYRRAAFSIQKFIYKHTNTFLFYTYTYRQIEGKT